ncbi:hypothetical protein SAMN05660831_00223 [Thiohalospira halophila DSM 15071]|uniref:Uncharacterized protein n=2 Tax=Thiohalospira halophila TaxID=381300 RepID=A0A1I1NJ67_9GAMM|nr:hypothetical protein SAMN05660831_00223 [Thiohalospira halophila DSM 15071]
MDSQKQVHQELVQNREAESALWDRLMAAKSASAGRSKEAIDAGLSDERESWDC